MVSFRLKTIIGIAIIEASLLFVLILSGLMYISESAQNEFINRATSTAKAFAVTTKDAVLATDIASLDIFVNEMLRYPDVLYARIKNHQGQLLASAGSPDHLKRTFELDNTFHDVDDGIFDANSIIRESGMTFGVVEIGLSINKLQQLVDDAKKYGISIALFEMFLVALFSFVLGGYLTRQLSSLTEGSQRIASGNFGFQIEARGKDELAQTARAFNTMSLKVRDIYDEINEREQYWRQVFNSTLDAVIVIDSQGIVKSYNVGAELMLGYTASEVIGQNVSMLMPEPHRHSHDEYIQNYMATGHANIIGKSRDFVIYQKNGEPLTINLRVTEMIDMEETLFIGVLHDISELKKNEATILQSLREKEVLLKEIHHRVKNNLMVVSSILDMQKSPEEDSVLNQAINTSQDRINSMSMIHEILYRSDDLSKVDFSSYLDALIDNLLSVYSTSNLQIHTDRQLDDLALNVETATPLGLIVNELVTNSMKYAFKSRTSGRLGISLKAHGEASFSLCVSDDGQSTKNIVNLETDSGLGWQLIKLLVKQLDAEITVDQSQGFKVCIEINELEYHKRGL